MSFDATVRRQTVVLVVHEITVSYHKIKRTLSININYCEVHRTEEVNVKMMLVGYQQR